MPRPFDITTPKDKVALDAEGKGQATFSVSNASGGTARGRARVVPGDPVQERWYRIEGDHERTLRDRQTTQYTVRVAPPRDAPGGEYSVRLDMISLDNMDEVAVEGPRVVVLCKGLAAPAPAKSSPKWLIPVIAAVVLLLVGTGVAVWALTRGPATVMVPDVASSGRALILDAAKAELETAGLKAELGDTQFDNEKPPNTVIAQRPVKDSKVTKGSIVTLTVTARDEVLVPDVTGRLLADCGDRLEERGLRAMVVDSRWLEGVAFNYVLEQAPDPGGKVLRGSFVALTVQGNRSPMRDCVGSVLSADLCRTLWEAGLSIEFHSRDEAGQHNFICGMSPVPPFAMGQTIELYVVRRAGMSEEEHKNEITNLLGEHQLLSQLYTLLDRARAQIIQP